MKSVQMPFPRENLLLLLRLELPEARKVTREGKRLKGKGLSTGEMMMMTRMEMRKRGERRKKMRREEKERERGERSSGRD